MRVQERPRASRPPRRITGLVRRDGPLEVLAGDLHREAISARQQDVERPDLDVQLVHGAGGQGLQLVVAVVRSVGPSFRGVEFPVRRAQPALRERRVRVDGALEVDLAPPVGREGLEGHEEVHVGGGRRGEELGGHGTREFGVVRQWGGVKGQAVLQGCEHGG